ncbi:hypothetical protein EC991_007788 [Linnemannia zychae]|nr:hypothetical protein EC991_007788 [Linnemannia zychae]
MSDANSPGGPSNTKAQTQTQTASLRDHRQHHYPHHAMDSVTAEASCKKLVSVLALDAGFEGITASALESLTRVFENYPAALTPTSKQLHNQVIYPNLSSSKKGLAAIKDSSHYSQVANLLGFVIETPLLRGPLQEIIAKPQRKKEKKTLLLDSDIEDNSDSEDEEDEKLGSAKVTARTIVPDHLPAFPSKHSYKQTPVFVKRPTDPQKIRELNAEQSRLVESNLKKLMAAENKVAMAAAHKDGGSTAAAAADLLLVKEEQQESIESIDRRALTKLEALPVVNYEQSKRQQQVSASNRDTAAIRSNSLLHDGQTGNGGHQRGESHTGEHAATGASGQSGSQQLSGKAEWRSERRRLRKEQLAAMEGMEHNLAHKRIRKESAYSGRLKLVSMDVDS